MELKDTIAGMLSDDYVERMIAEYRQLSIRIVKLTREINNYRDKYSLVELELLNRQVEAMEQYKKILRLRASLDNINLD